MTGISLGSGREGAPFRLDGDALAGIAAAHIADDARLGDIGPLLADSPAHPSGWRCALRVMGAAEARRLAAPLRPTHVVSIRAPAQRCQGIAAAVEAEHLALVVDDTLDVAAATAMRDTVRRGLDFAHGLPGDARLLVHCAAGISRSTALVLAILARYLPPEAAGALLHAIRPTAVPNLLMAAEADALMEAGGALLSVARRFPCRSWERW